MTKAREAVAVEALYGVVILESLEAEIAMDLARSRGLDQLVKCEEMKILEWEQLNSLIFTNRNSKLGFDQTQTLIYSMWILTKQEEKEVTKEVVREKIKQIIYYLQLIA
jgi:hypothetical protein